MWNDPIAQPYIKLVEYTLLISSCLKPLFVSLLQQKKIQNVIKQRWTKPAVIPDKWLTLCLRQRVTTNARHFRTPGNLLRSYHPVLLWPATSWWPAFLPLPASFCWPSFIDISWYRCYMSYFWWPCLIWNVAGERLMSFVSLIYSPFFDAQLARQMQSHSLHNYVCHIRVRVAKATGPTLPLLCEPVSGMFHVHVSMYMCPEYLSGAAVVFTTFSIHTNLELHWLVI